MREKQSVRKDIWYLARRKRFKKKNKKRTKRCGATIGLTASAAAPFLGEIVKLIYKQFSVGEGEKGDETKHISKTTHISRKSLLTKRNIVHFKVRKSQ